MYVCMCVWGGGVLCMYRHVAPPLLYKEYKHSCVWLLLENNQHQVDVMITSYIAFLQQIQVFIQ